MRGLTHSSLRSAAILLAISCSAGGRAFGDPVTVIDTLRGVPTSTVFDIQGAGFGVVPSNAQLIGPLFTVPDRFVLTHFGAFANLCNATVGDTGCTHNSPLLVQILPVIGNLPQLGNVVASFSLSNDNDFAHISYESATLRLEIAAGDYVALLSTDPFSFGLLLSHAASPFEYTAGVTPIAFVSPSFNNAVRIFPTTVALRIEGTIHGEPSPVPEPSSFLLAATGFALVRQRRSRATR